MTIFVLRGERKREANNALNIHEEIVPIEP